MFRFRWLTAFVTIAAALVLLTADANARPGGGFSSGSRGMRTFSSPPSTPTAPTAAPIQRSMTQPSTAAPFGQATPNPGFFGGRGLFGGLAAGFLGAGLFGLLFGQGIFAWWQRRNMSAAPSFAGARPASGYSFSSPGGISNGTSAPQPADPLTIAKPDYDAFERLLGDIQAAYSAEDLSALRTLVTPEMLSYFSEELAGNASRGLINRVTDVHLLQGDLAEAWREGGTDYATVAMKFALNDSMVERASSRTVEGGERSEVTELWTFMRARGGNWLLSAIQQS
jgi:predicted lipid-binding transport protein (Tim44 family)